MDIKHLNPDTVATSKLPFSNVVVASGFCFISGQAALDPKTGELMVKGEFADEAKLVFQNLLNNLAAVGLSAKDVVKVNAYLGDLSHIREYNELYRKYFPAPHPARTTIGCMMGDIRLEIDCIAYLGNSGG